MRPLEDLVDTAEPGWPLVEGWLKTASNTVEVLPVDVARAGVVLTALQVSTRSPMGAIAHHSGGLVIDRWLRVLGSGGARMRGDLLRWNGLGENPVLGGIHGGLIIALDAVGGVFSLFEDTRKVGYFAPDTLKWEDLELGYSPFVESMLRSDLDAFFNGLRWDGWRQDITALSLDEGFSVYPPLWSAESRTGVPSRKPVPLHELVASHFAMKQQLDGQQLAVAGTLRSLPDGGR